MKALLKQNPLLLAGGVVLILGAVYFFGRKTLAAAADTVGGVVSGNNAVTAGTAYEGKGVLGTVGAVFNDASGGLFASVGGAIGQTLYDWTHNDDNI